MTLTQSRTLQYLGLILIALILGVSYWYFSVRAGVRTNTSLSQPAGVGRLDSGLSAYYAFDASSGSSATDSSTNGNTGTLTNMETPTDWVAGQVGNSLDFDGVDEYVTVADTAIQDFGDTESFTISGWFNRDTATTTDTIVAKRNGVANTDDGYICYLDATTDQLICEVSEAGGTDEYSVTSTSTFTATGWNHFAFVWDQGSATATEIYINGAANNATDSGTIGNLGDLSNADAFRIGAESDAGNPFDGKLDEIRVYNRPLAPDEIGQLYRLTAPTGVDTGLKGYWSFDGSGMATSTIARDLSGARNTGTLTGGPTRATGRVGQGLTTDGTDDYVSIADHASLDFNNADFTLSGWFARGSATTDDTIIAKRNGIANTDDGYLCYIDDATDRLTCEVSDNADTDEFQLESNIAITDTNWHHFTLVWDDDSTANTEIYIDGVATSATETGTQANIGDLSNAVVLAIGAESDAGNPFVGRVDEVRVYNRALAATEVQAQYQLSERDEVNTSASQAQGSGRLDSGVIAYWPLDETTGATATDASNGGNNMTLTNMENADWVTGRIGNGLDFDGVDEYGTSSSTVPDRGSMSVWVKSGASLDTGAYWIALFGGDASNYISLYADTFSINNSYCFALRGNFGTSIGGCGLKFASTATFQEWHHLAATWDATKGLKLYIDGALSYSTTTGTNALLSMNLGLSINDATQNWLGRLDEVRMYNRILSAEEVSQLYRLTTTTPIETSLKGYWSMNGHDMAGSTIFDSSGSGFNGTITGTVTPSVGIVGQALDFQGSSDYVTTSDSASLKPANFTLSVWTYADTGDASTYRLIFKPSYSDSGFDSGWSLFQADESTTTGPYGVRWGDGTNPTAGDVIGTSNIVGGWHQAVVTFDGTTMRLYVDGILQNSGNASTLAYSATNFDSVIGYGTGNGLNDFDGRIDEVRLYNRVFTAAEVKAQYEAAQPDRVNTSVVTPQGTGRPDSGVALYWPLDNGSGTTATDTSTNGNNGTLTGGPTWTTGQVVSAVDFDGTDDYVTVADADALDVVDATSFTLSGWFNRDTFTSDDTIVAKRNGTAAGDTGYLCYVAAADQLICEVSDGTDEYSLTSTGTFAATGWNHFALVWDEAAGSARLYVNGGPDGYATPAGSVSSIGSLANSVAFRAGAEGDAGNPFDGKLDEVRLYKRALSGDEVANLYRTVTPTGMDTGLKGYWSFNGPDIAGTTAFDRSGAGNNGTLTNTPTKTIGKLGQALNFVSASTQYVDVGSATSLDDLTSKSVCAWVKPNSLLTVGGAVLGKFTVTPGGWEMVLDYVTLTSLRLGWYQTFNGADGYWLTTSAIPYNSWTHVCTTYNNSSATNDPVLYVDGSPVSTVENITPTGTVDPEASGTAYIGVVNNGSFVDKFDGAIDEVRLYNRILTAAEVKALYDTGR